MTSDLHRFLRAVRTLAGLARKYDVEPFIEAAGRYATRKQEGDIRFVGTFLDDIGCVLAERRVRPCCRQCGEEIGHARYNDHDARADAQYCSPACRQRAYRSRVTAGIENPERKRNGNGPALRPDQQKQPQAVTGGAS